MKQILVRYINIILGAIVAAFALEEFFSSSEHFGRWDCGEPVLSLVR